jgi:hypothetical protein
MLVISNWRPNFTIWSGLPKPSWTWTRRAAGVPSSAWMGAAARVHKLAQRLPVEAWVADPRQPQRELAWLEPETLYVVPTRQIIIRSRFSPQQKYRYAVLVTNAPPALLAQLSPLDVPCADLQLLQLAYAYDQRSGGLETHHRGDKQGLGIQRRYKRLFHAQEMLILLAQLAHNLLIWLEHRLRPYRTAGRLGMQRLVRDGLTIPGQLYFDHHGRLHGLVLNSLHPLANAVFRAFEKEWLSLGLRLSLRQF